MREGDEAFSEAGAFIVDLETQQIKKMYCAKYILPVSASIMTLTMVLLFKISP